MDWSNKIENKNKKKSEIKFVASFDDKNGFKFDVCVCVLLNLLLSVVRVDYHPYDYI